MHSDFIQSCGVTIWKIKSKPEVSTERLLVREPKKKKLKKKTVPLSRKTMHVRFASI